MYPLTFFTDNLAEGQGGVANGPIIRIRLKYKDDQGIYQHELTHVKQWFATLTLHSLLYLWRPYRLWSEAQAYTKQMLYLDRNGARLLLDGAAARLAGKSYDLGITVDEAKVILEKAGRNVFFSRETLRKFLSGI